MFIANDLYSILLNRVWIGLASFLLYLSSFALLSGGEWAIQISQLGVILGFGTLLVYVYIDTLGRLLTPHFCLYLFASIVIIGCYAMQLCSIYELVLIFHATMLTLLYMRMVYPLSGVHRNFKTVYTFKSMIIAYVWTLLCIALPTIDEYMRGNYTVGFYGLFILERFSYLVALCIIYDIKDIKGDLAEDLRTLATYFKPATMKILFCCLLAFSSLLSLWIYPFGVAGIIFVTNLLGCLYTSQMYVLARKKKLYATLVDGHIILQSLGILCFFYGNFFMSCKL